MNKTELRPDYFFEMSMVNGSDDCNNIIDVVNQGIDSRLTGFTNSEFKWSNDRLFCWVHFSEMEVLIRRLNDLYDNGNDNAGDLADNIIYVHYGKESV